LEQKNLAENDGITQTLINVFSAHGKNFSLKNFPTKKKSKPKFLFCFEMGKNLNM
jgi:hypothetical protein